MVSAAEREVLYASGELSPSETELTELRAATERGVRVVLVGSATVAGTVPRRRGGRLGARLG